MDAIEGFILTYTDGPRVGHRIGNTFYGTEGAAKSARTNMFGDYMRFIGLPQKERQKARAAHAATKADIVPLYRRLRG